MLRQTSIRPNTTRHIAVVKKDFRDALHAILRFAEREDCGGFINNFANAISAIENPSADIGYHKDLTLPGQLCDDAQAVLKASMSAWVFGGMGSWNDMRFDGVAQQEYESLSEILFNLLNEAIEVIAKSTVPQQ